MKKLFAPDLMLNDYIKSCWHRNIKTNAAGKIPIQQELRDTGIYAIEIEPEQLTNDKYWAIGFPLNSAWEDEEPVAPKRQLHFDCVISTPMAVGVKFQSTSNEASETVTISNTDSWQTYTIGMPNAMSELNLIVFSGPIRDCLVLLKNVVLT